MPSIDGDRIYEVTSYVTDNGRRVVRLHRTIDEPLAEFLRGEATVPLQEPTPQNRGKVPAIKLEFNFPDGTSVEEAFGMWDDMVQKGMDEFHRQQPASLGASPVKHSHSLVVPPGITRAIRRGEGADR